MLQTIFIFIGSVIAGVLLYAATLPSQFYYESREFIRATPEQIFPWLVDVKRAEEWSPWKKVDATMQSTFSATTSGIGAYQQWEAKKMGNGRATIVNVVPNRDVEVRLDMYTPMESTSTAHYLLAPKDGGTEIAWTIEGKQNYIGKLFTLVFNCEKMMKKTFADGLATLKQKVE